jgi:hypothetical protein
MEEKAKAEKADLARIEAVRKCQLAEKERDVYRLLARRWKSRLNASSGEADGEAETIEEAAAAILLGGRESVSLFGIGHMFRRFRYRASVVNSDGIDEQDDEDIEPTYRMEEDESEEDDDDDDDDDEMNEDSEEEEQSNSEHVTNGVSNDPMVGISRSISKIRSQARTVSTVSTASLSEVDF